MKLLFLSLTLLSSLSTIAMEVVPSSSKDNVKLLHDGKRTFVEDETAAYRVENFQMNTLVRQLIEREALSKFVKEDGYVRITKDNENMYKLAAKVRGNGGTGPITAFSVGLAVRVGMYTGYLLAASTPVIVGTATTGPAGTLAGAAAVQVAVTAAGGAAGIIATTEATANAATLWTLALPFPLP